jgi:hypothetical protein
VNSEDAAMLSFPQLELLGEAGPAQTDLLIHFCGRPFGRQSTPRDPDEIRNMSPQTRLYPILWQQQLRGFAPFGADDPDDPLHREPTRPPELATPPRLATLGLALTRQSLYHVGGRPAWYVRSPQ